MRKPKAEPIRTFVVPFDALSVGFYPRISLQQLQYEHRDWSFRNFPGSRRRWDHSFLGVVEEVGELAHALLKSQQGIRGTKAEHEAAAKDAVGDIVVFLSDLCTKRGWDFETIVTETWAEVKKRDWTKDKKTGKKIGQKRARKGRRNLATDYQLGP